MYPQNPEIDLSAPGGVDALLALHRSVFGNIRMEGEPAPDPKPDPAPEPKTDPATPDPKSDPAQDVKSLPEYAQKMIADLRKEAADNRVARTAAEKAAADTKAVVDAINKAMNPNSEADPKQLAEQLTAAQAKHREAEVRLAVFSAAGAAGANPAALLDRNSFHKAIAGLDPSAADFTAKVTAAITAAVASDPTLKTVRAAGASSTDHGAGGSGEGGARPKSIQEALQRA